MLRTMLAGLVFLAFCLALAPAGVAQNVNVPDAPAAARGADDDGDFWRAIRQGVQGQVTIPDRQAAQLIQSEGETWRSIRNGPLSTWGAWGVLGMIGLIALFFLVRGRVRLEGGWAGRTIVRFSGIERMSHWLMAVSFILLALTGLNVLYGRYTLLPLLTGWPVNVLLSPSVGAEIFAQLTLYGKFIHDYVAFAFMAGLVLSFVLWVGHNLPTYRDVVWLAKGGGILVRGVHVKARKFNAGQKLMFWLVMLGGLSVSLSGIALLFPYQTAFFAKTFSLLNQIGFDLPTAVTPLQEQQLNQVWHAAMGLFLTAVIIAHIYIGTIGMEGAFSAMGSGTVDYNWAKEHHGLWVEQVEQRSQSRPAAGDAPPAPAE